jgi:nucleoside-diphosphate-sugar epimerase
MIVRGEHRTVLVTGAGGYVGSALAMRLAERGWAVVGFGHGSRYPALRRRLPEGVTLVSGDLADGDAVRRLTRGVDAVVHAGSVTGEASCRRDLCGAVRTIVRGTRMVVDAVRENGVGALVHLSTYAVYSTFRERPMPLAEDMKLLPDDVYGALKAEAEWEASRVPSAILRLTNVYGVGSGIVLKRDVIGRFVTAAREGTPLTIYGEGRQGIDFVHVDDVCRVVAEVLDLPRREGPLVLNVGSGAVTSIRRLAETAAALAREIHGRDVAIVSQDAPPGKIWPDRWVATERLTRLCPWFPAAALEQGLREIMRCEWDGESDVAS